MKGGAARTEPKHRLVQLEPGAPVAFPAPRGLALLQQEPDRPAHTETQRRDRNTALRRRFGRTPRPRHRGLGRPAGVRPIRARGPSAGGHQPAALLWRAPLPVQSGRAAGASRSRAIRPRQSGLPTLKIEGGCAGGQKEKRGEERTSSPPRWRYLACLAGITLLPVTGVQALRLSLPYSPLPQHFLNFLPLPQGQGSLRPVLGPRTMGSWVRMRPSV